MWLFLHICIDLIDRYILERMKVPFCFMECKKTLYLCINTKGEATTLCSKPIFMSPKTGVFCYESPFFIYWIQSLSKVLCKRTPDYSKYSRPSFTVSPPLMCYPMKISDVSGVWSNPHSLHLDRSGWNVVLVSWTKFTFIAAVS